MRMVVLPRYTRLGASSRLRMLQPKAHLIARGLHPDTRSLFDDAYLKRLYSEKQMGWAVFAAYCRRLRDLRRARDVDLLWIEKELLPWIPWAVEHAVMPRRVPYAVDYDDAVFHTYDLNRFAPVRYFLGSKLDRLMEGSALVTAGNAYLAERAIRAGARHVEIVPTVVDTDAYFPALSSDNGPPCLGWIGSPSTWSAYMAPIMPMLTEIAMRSSARLMAVGAGSAATLHPLLDQRDWSEATEIDLIQQMDIGIMPLTDSPWARGKCGYKLIQYMACGLPVVASPVGVNANIVEHGVNGFLATTEREWQDALETLLKDPELRQKMGKAGRRKVEAHYSLQAWGPRLADLLLDTAKRS